MPQATPGSQSVSRTPTTQVRASRRSRSQCGTTQTSVPSALPSRKCPVAKTGHDEQVYPSSIFCKIYTPKFLLTTTMRSGARHWMGNSKHTNLASSTIVKEGANKKVPGALVLYHVKVKLALCQGEDVPVALPFMLMHLKPRCNFLAQGCEKTHP
uniref:Uncharacterized protein n=1 Tax=Gopherus evgoodei TaxID=1825980 RepID=A0A8C4YGX3_9SAUR